MKNKGGQEDGCCWVLLWDTGKQGLFIFFFSFVFPFRQVQTNYKSNLFGAPCLLTWKSPNNLAVLGGN
jgi:hypothetical protein